MILSLQSDLLEGAVAPGGPGTTRLLPTEMVKLLDLLHWLACNLEVSFALYYSQMSVSASAVSPVSGAGAVCPPGSQAAGCAPWSRLQT